jgi:hypothetical protein
MYSLWNACVVSAGLVLMTYILVNSGKIDIEMRWGFIGRRIFMNMYVEKGQAITGKIERDQINDPSNIRFN